MNEWFKTLGFVASALVLLLLVALTGSPGDANSESFDDQGELFFEDLKPEELRALEVTSYEEETATLRRFALSIEPDPESGKDIWVIATEGGYPVDQDDKLRQIAADVLNLRKDAIRSDLKSDHKDLGVIDPDDSDGDLVGLGTKVRLFRGDGQEAMAEFIVGKPVPGRDDQRFVRVPGINRTYAVQLDLDLTTVFGDWVDSRPFEINAAEARRLVLDDLRLVRGSSGRVGLAGEPLTLRREDDTSDWEVQDGRTDAEAGLELVNTKVSSLVSGLANLEILGVDPKPAEATAELGVDMEAARSLSSEQQVTLQRSLDRLQGAGFFLINTGQHPTPQLMSETSEVRIGNEQGVEYVLRFGNQTQVSVADNAKLSQDDSDADAEESEDEGDSAEPSDAADDGDEGTLTPLEALAPDQIELPTVDEGEDEPEEAEARFVILTTRFDESLLPPFQLPNREIPSIEEVFEDPFVPTEEEAQAAEEAYQERVQEAEDEREKLIEEGREAAEQLRKKFDGWVYLIEESGLSNVLIDRSELLREPTADGEDSPPTTPGGNPLEGIDFNNLPGLMGPNSSN